MKTFVNLTPDVRTYVASVKVNPHFDSALAATSREGRKAAAYNAMVAAERDTSTALVPKLDALKQQGLLSSYELVAGTGAIILNVPKGKAGASFDALRGVAELSRIVRNREVRLDDVTEDPTPTPPPTPPAVTTEYNVSKLGVQKLWDAGITGKGVVVGFVDTGANTTHEALKAKYRGTKADGTQDHNYNFFDGVNGRKDAYDDHNHGSHVAGTTMGGTANHLIGMAPDAKFISAKVFTAGGSGSTATILKGLGWMLAPTDSNGQNADPTKAPDIVSNSWGNSNGAALNYLDAWKAFEAAGIIPVVAAGNSGPRAKTIGAPGSYAQSITIAATDKDDKIASFSSRGPSPIKDANGQLINKPDFAAPGVSVTSAGKDGNSYVTMSGTSMATPAAAGVIALLLSKYPQLKTEQIREILAKSAVDLGTAGWDPEYGAGRIDAPAALVAATKLVTPPPPAPPAGK
jgi:subtilisin family serine protease